jgi:hypothetical protein
MNSTVYFSLKRFFGMVAVFVLGLTLVACAGSSEKAEPPAEKAKPPAEEQATEQKGSLSRTFTIVDEQGRKSGTLILEFGGGAVLHDESGKVIGTFRAEELSETQPVVTPSEPEQSETPSEPEPSEVQSESKPMETEPEAEPSEAQPDTKAKE